MPIGKSFMVVLTLLPSSFACAQGAPNLETISRLAAGYAWATICDRRIDLDVATAFLDRQFGAEAAFNSRQLAEAMMLADGTIGLESTLAGSGPRACAAAMQSFGPGGDAIPGLLK